MRISSTIRFLEYTQFVARSARGGFALVLTLAVLVLIAIVVTTYLLVARFESVTARSDFESKRAEIIASFAIDEVIAKLRDNIPPDAMWAAGPGRIYSTKTGRMTELYSGEASSSTTGLASLNLPTPGVASEYPILPKNLEYPSPGAMQVAWINVLKDGTLSTGAGYAPTTSNPIVGRYAYWTDAENAKVNLNTAGRALTNYVFQPSSPQNWTASPSRIDLSALDSVTESLSAATHNFTASTFWSDADPSVVRPPGESLRRFNSTAEWKMVPGVTEEIVEDNKCYITTLGRSPELTPWGLNRLWWQSAPPQLPVDSGEKQFGNKANAPGAPVYPPSATRVPGLARSNPSLKTFNADFRYYVYPFQARATATSGDWYAGPNNMQWLAAGAIRHGGPSASSQFLQNMMRQFERTDWPGMPAGSFVEKYGREECENLAVNMLFLYDSAVNRGGNAPGWIHQTGATGDAVGVYGESLFSSPSDPNRKLWGVGAWPYINEVAVQFSPTLTGKDVTGTDGTRLPGFCNPIDAADHPNWINVQIQPQVELWYPPHLANGNTFATRNSNGYSTIGICDVQVEATGILDGQPKTYTGPSYYCGYANEAGGFPENKNAWGLVAPPAAGIIPSAVPQWFSNPKRYFIGPFDKNTHVTVTTRFRVFSTAPNLWTALALLQIVPLDTNTQGWSNYANVKKLTFTAEVDLSNPTGVWKSFEAVDPRVYRYESDWKPCTDPLGHTLGAKNSNYVSTFTDPLTGVTGDDSKLAWPDTSAADYYLQHGANAAYNLLQSHQHAGNITTFPGIGWLSVLPTNCESSRFSQDASHTPGTYSPIPWRTISLGPATKTDQLPDWLLLELFSVAYEHTYLSQSDGKINLNASLVPFGLIRKRPLEALLKPPAENPNADAQAIASDIASHDQAQSGPCAALPADLFVYPGQLCQIPRLQLPGSTQWQKEALMRDIAGIVTTQCNDFKVYVVAQAVKQKSFSGDLAKDLVVLAERRVEAVVSRVVDVGPDDVPGTSDDMAGPDRITGTSDDLKFKDGAGAESITKLNYNRSDPYLESYAGRPPFRFEITNFKILAN